MPFRPASAVLVFATGLALAQAPTPRSPNVVFVLADDLGYGDLGCYGQQKIRTPRLDQLASEGMRLLRHCAGSPVCAPSRCVLMTGKHPGHAAVRARTCRRARSSPSCTTSPGIRAKRTIWPRRSPNGCRN